MTNPDAVRPELVEGPRPTLAIIPLAGKATRHRPASYAIPKGLFPLVDVDGKTKPTIQLILEEAFESGIERACLVTGPGEDGPFQRYLDIAHREGAAPWAPTVTFAVQPTPEGYGHAVYCARDAAAGQPALVMLGDTIYESYESRRCSAQLLDAYARCGASVSGLQRLTESQLAGFGTVRGEPMPALGERTYRVRHVIEKPTPAQARESLVTPGLPTGTYLGWFGLHAVSAGIFDVLAEDVALDRRERGEFQFTGAQARLAEREPYFGCEIAGRHMDMGDPATYVQTQLDLHRIRTTHRPSS
ncbi:MAG TPA: sugar phosphate nucleotidyltransferase [Chloroflexota bacterium]|nr:sugar phosphate nucleotidyltransferase [Chloroflexota bacterium]